MTAWRVIARREFRDLAGGRAYLITTVLGAILILALSFLPAIVQSINAATARPVGWCRPILPPTPPYVLTGTPCLRRCGRS